jgi:cation transport protein ChaC
MEYKNGIWVFGYGSLMWNPGFAYDRQQLATLSGYARSFCLWSVHYRGTIAAPGLVLGLDRQAGARCEGVAYFVPASLAQKAHLYLRERELVSYAYLEQLEPLTLDSGEEVPAICYIVDRSHAQYAGGLALARKAGVITKARGSAGDNLAYLENTTAHMRALGIRDEECEALLAMIRSGAPSLD